MSIKVRARIAVIRLNRSAFFHCLFTVYYHLAWLGFSRATRLLFPEMTSIRVHRGYSTREWEPGISDIDAVLEIRELSPRETARFIARWNKFYTLIKAVFPILGEIIIASRAEEELYREWGDIRAASALRQTPANPELMEAKTALDLWTEALHSHTQLCKLAISNTCVPAPIAGRALRKCVLDVARHCAALRAYPPLGHIGSRLETENSLAGPGQPARPELGEVLARAQDTRSDGARMKELAQLACAHTANILETEAVSLRARLTGFIDTAPTAPLISPEPEQNAAAGRISGILKDELGTFFHSAVFDNVFGSFVVLNQVPGDAAELARGIAILNGMTARHLSMRGAIFPLGPVSVELMGFGTYGDDPLKLAAPERTASGSSPFVCNQSGGRPPLSAHRRTFFGEGEAAFPSAKAPLLDALYLESLSHFLRTWRGLLEPGAGGAIYAVSRAVALWLYFVKKTPRPCFPLQPLLQTFLREKNLPEGGLPFEESLLLGLRPRDIEMIAVLNAETLAAAPSVAAMRAAAENLI
ncbi:MAG: hypothetical protein A2234_08230 [Elusimicrobia bacterium RIFOXYA2_FULL_58_8]|nr:MAG: hypothetical protein A2285_01365 [Elusimicrobia bacterium RIFOXYA12_FULL_57_11]OGS17063.1 MAG: hypothetical protein A2234_08230 [Elusimicrobia bacterium RIFOXYA2_FULL_58_8]